MKNLPSQYIYSLKLCLHSVAMLRSTRRTLDAWAVSHPLPLCQASPVFITQRCFGSELISHVYLLKLEYVLYLMVIETTFFFFFL